METFCITGMGMVTSLGLDVNTCCAAARAGIVRPTEIDTFPVRSPEDGEISGLVVHAVPMITEGFEGDARLQRLATAALKDLQKQTPHEPWKQGKTAFYLSLPDPRRVYTGTALIPNEEERKEKEEEAKEAMQEPVDESRAHNLLKFSARLSGWPAEPELRFTTTSGNTGFAEALHKAIEDLLAGYIQVAVVGGVDSLLDEVTLAWLENTGRLKTPDLPVGLQPGEAGAFVVLETLRGVGASKGKVLSVVESVRLGIESRTLLSGEPPLGEGLATLIGNIVGSNDRMERQPMWFITDQNGETYRAMEWGNALVRLMRNWPMLREANLWFATMSFGDTGAANGVVSACVLLKGFKRDYAPVKVATILSSAEGMSRSLVTISFQ